MARAVAWWLLGVLGGLGTLVILLGIVALAAPALAWVMIGAVMALLALLLVAGGITVIVLLATRASRRRAQPVADSAWRRPQ